MRNSELRSRKPSPGRGRSPPKKFKPQRTQSSQSMEGGNEVRVANVVTLPAEASKYLENVESPSVLLVRGHIVRRSSFTLLITATKPKTPSDRERQLALYKLSRKVRVRVYSTAFPEC